VITAPAQAGKLQTGAPIAPTGTSTVATGFGVIDGAGELVSFRRAGSR
jgi:hypothetical protein